MNVQVSKGHIETGQKQKCQSCPVALALAEATGVLWHVTPSYLIVWRGRLVPHVTTPEEVQRFIRDFDAGKAVQPFSFEIPWPPAEEGQRDAG